MLGPWAVADAPEDEVCLQEHAATRDHPRREPPEVADRVERPRLHLVAVGALQQRARQALVLGAACAQRQRLDVSTRTSRQPTGDRPRRMDGQVSGIMAAVGAQRELGEPEV